MLSRSEIGQRLNEVRVFRKFTAIGVKNRNAMRQDIGNDSVTRFAHNHIRRSHEILIAVLKVRKNSEIAAASFLVSGSQEKELLRSAQSIQRQPLEPESAEAQKNHRRGLREPKLCTCLFS